MKSLARQRKIFILCALAIPVTLLVCFVVIPAIDLIRMSFTDWDGYSPSMHFVKLETTLPCSKMPTCGRA